LRSNSWLLYEQGRLGCGFALGDIIDTTDDAHLCSRNYYDTRYPVLEPRVHIGGRNRSGL